MFEISHIRMISCPLLMCIPIRWQRSQSWNDTMTHACGTVNTHICMVDIGHVMNNKQDRFLCHTLFRVQLVMHVCDKVDQQLWSNHFKSASWDSLIFAPFASMISTRYCRQIVRVVVKQSWHVHNSWCKALALIHASYTLRSTSWAIPNDSLQI